MFLSFFLCSFGSATRISGDARFTSARAFVCHADGFLVSAQGVEFMESILTSPISHEIKG